MTKAIHLAPAVMYRIAAALICALLLTACSSKPTAETSGDSPAPVQQPAIAEITPDEVVVTDVKLLRGADGKGYRVEGQVHNTSEKVSLAEFEFQLVMQDCLDDGSCNILARDMATIPAKVAPGQAAPFEYTPNLSDMPTAQGHLGYHYTIAAAR
jgi:hypothetical protein